MPCKLCGDVCRCSSNPDLITGPLLAAQISAQISTQVADDGHSCALPLQEQPVAETADFVGTNDSFPVPSASSVAADPTPAEDPGAWRQELSVRLNRYQSRRKPKPPRYPSLRLRFEQDEYPPPTTTAPLEEFTARDMHPITNQALALDPFASDFSVDFDPTNTPSYELEAAAPETAAWNLSSATVNAPTGKLLEFPRSWTPPAPPLDELAEPVTTRPRILEAPEIVPPPPALGGITIASEDRPEVEKRPGIDIPLRAAPLSHRFFAAVIDNLIIAFASVIFAAIFWKMSVEKMSAAPPAPIQIIGLLAGLSAVLWAAYQYLLVVYGGTTPGLRLMHLELSRFDGSATDRRMRRWRVLAAFLSAISLGMGYGWVFLDEDSLCWHDRITHSYLAPSAAEKSQ